MNTTVKKQRIKNKRILALSTAVLLAILVVLFIYIQKNDSSNNMTKDSNGSSFEADIKNSTNLDPATNDELKSAEENKKTLSEDPESAKKINVTPIITFLGIRNNNLEVRSYMPEVYEDTGKCTINVKNLTNGLLISKMAEGIKDVTYTRCNRIVIPVEELGSGNFEVYVSYESETANGDSAKQEIQL